MRDFYVVVDGFIYEEKEIRMWLNGGNDKLLIIGVRFGYCYFIFNYIFCLFIKDWFY